MNHWAIGRLDGQSVITIPESVLRPISINIGSMVWGMFYPVSQTFCSCDMKSDDDYTKFVRPEIDFVFSSIPFDIWPRSARCIVRIAHAPEAFREITHAIKECNASIIVSDASRSTHSYDTWRLIISCDNLDISKDAYVQKERQFKGMFQELDNIRNVIEDKCNKYLFRDPCDKTRQMPVVCTPHNTMAYFYALSKNMSIIHNKNDFEDWAICNNFIMRRQEDGTIKSVDKVFASIIKDINRQKDNDILPSYCFVESQSDDMSMRMVVIPRKREKNFYKLTVGFTRSAPPSTSKGFVDYVLSNICNEAKVWAINNKTRRFQKEVEDGEAEFIIEGKAVQDIVKRINLIEKAINTNTLPSHLKKITDIRTMCDTLSSAFVYQNKKDEEKLLPNDLFISHSSDDANEAKKLKKFLVNRNLACFFSSKEDGEDPMPLGDYRDALRNQIISSKIIIIVCSISSINSKWVLTEIGAAWALNKPIIPIMLEIEAEDIPKQIIGYNHAINYEDAIDPDGNFVDKIRKIISKTYG